LVVEPLRALIASQIVELENRGLNVVKLLTADEASSAGMHGPKYLENLAKVYSRQKSLIIFSTPELLSLCIDQNGPICTLVKQGLMSLVVLDEFDCISESHEQYRKAYTTIIPHMKELVKDSPIPFLYLSATGSSDQIYEVLYKDEKLLRTIPPILFQSTHILPQHHVYSGTSIDTTNSM
jgi:superfamily II DNA helicase RecQ